MKYILIFIIFISACSTAHKISYSSFMNEKNEKVLQGVINRQVIEADTTFKWFGLNYKYSQTNKAAVEVFRKQKSKYKLLVFGGTWCEDTQNLLPLFYKVIDESGFNTKHVTLVGVDRKKNSGNGMSDKYKIEKVPVFIVLDKNDIEVGRVVEYGKSIGIDNELAEMIEKL